LYTKDKHGTASNNCFVTAAKKEEKLHLSGKREEKLHLSGLMRTTNHLDMQKITYISNLKY
jgi:hypothetical protein